MRRIDGMQVDSYEAAATFAGDSFVCDCCGETFPGAALYGDGCDLCADCAEQSDEQESESAGDVDGWLAVAGEQYDDAVAKIEAMAAAEIRRAS